MLRIRNGTVYDPLNGINGEVRDVCIQDGRIVPSVEGGRTIDATGMVVMPGGVDMHSHIAGPKVNIGRKLQPEDHRTSWHVERRPGLRAGAGGIVPSTFATGYRYAGLGYTTAFDAAISPLGARHAHEELQDTPVIDKGFYTLLGNNQFVLEHLARGEQEKVREYVAWLLGAAKSYAVKVVNPGGAEAWKQHGNAGALDEPVAPYGVTPRQIITGLAAAVDELGLPHPLHLHCNHLGLPGNFLTTLETMRALEGRRAHLAHLQFHSYGGEDWSSFSSEAPVLAEYVNDHPNLSVDVGQVVFGPATTMTADGPWQHLLYRLSGERWVNEDIEAESGCGVVPYRYRDKNLVNAVQWAAGLELFLLIEDPWRVYLTTDHPNAGSFLSYPKIIQWLMDRDARQEVLKGLPPAVRERTTLEHLDREYDLYEIAIITRAAPARSLGLTRKGHLGIGADGDVVIYSRDRDIEAMFQSPRYVIKGGRVVVEEGELREELYGRTFYVAPDYDGAIEEELRRFFEDHYSIQFDNYPVQMEYLPDPEVVPCKSGE